MTKVFVLDEGRTTEGQRDSWLVGWLVGWLEFIVSLENFSLILRRHHCR